MGALTSEADRHIKVSYHSAIYRWASERVTGKTVLDAGCGAAYGTAILAGRAAHVTGVDKSAPAIVAIAGDYRLPNTAYQVMDCQAMTFPDGAFDVVVSNALLEYLTDCDAFFDEVARVLKPGGLFICGTKNADLSMKNADGSPLYPDHNQEYNPHGLRAALAARLDDVHMFGEVMQGRSEAFIMDRRALGIEGLLVRLNVKHLIPLKWRNTVRRWMTGVEVNAIQPEDFDIVSEAFDKAFYIVGIGTKP
ncbi:MAG: class I SAM-dependent methyltransferase [Anaerolineae bacterium]|nr:class I SAM-dependent methyltransferase [Anaerolineae bacterium]